LQLPAFTKFARSYARNVQMISGLPR
jgi:hypothetical protein